MHAHEKSEDRKQPAMRKGRCAKRVCARVGGWVGWVGRRREGGGRPEEEVATNLAHCIERNILSWRRLD